jgi:hypothetical protein
LQRNDCLKIKTLCYLAVCKEIALLQWKKPFFSHIQLSLSKMNMY